MNAESNAPLTGIRVLDLTRVIAGPYCTMQLADMGADVIKIENPEGGDDSRHIKPPDLNGESHFYLAFNRNKKSVVLNLRAPEGRQIIRDLAAKSDVLIENFRPGVMKRFGLDYASMKESHPHLIYLSISAYGQKGMMSDRPGFDPVLQAEFGMMSITGEPEGQPMRHPLAFVDIFTSIHSVAAICAALYVRKNSGRGQYIEMSLMTSAICGLSNAAAYYLTSGENPRRVGNQHMASVPSNLFETQTGPIFIAVGNERLFGKLCRNVFNRPDILDDPRFSTQEQRSANREELNDVLREIFAGDTRENWLAKMRDLPAGAVRTIGEALESDDVAEQGMLQTVNHPYGPLRVIKSVYRFSETPVVEPKAPPLQGADTEATLRELLGYDTAKIDDLRKKKVIENNGLQTDR